MSAVSVWRHLPLTALGRALGAQGHPAALGAQPAGLGRQLFGGVGAQEVMEAKPVGRALADELHLVQLG